MTNSDFVAELLIDVDYAQRRQKVEDTPVLRRNLVRTVFAAVEGIVWMFRQHVIEVVEEIGLLQEDERIALMDASYSVGSDGEVRSQPKFVSFAATIRLVAQLAKRADSNFNVEFGDGGWEKLRSTTALRNRITHPKRSGDMVVSDAEVTDCLAALYWLIDVATDAMDSSLDALKLHSVATRQLVEELKAGDPTAWEEYLAVKHYLEQN